MTSKTLWDLARDVQIETGPEIVGGFDVGFDERIPEKTRDAVMDFVYWVEDHYALPVTLWVDVEWKHYLVSREKKRVGYLFYWVDADLSKPFDREADIPVIRLPVRPEYTDEESILVSFIQGLCCYYRWLTTGSARDYCPEETLVEEILCRWKTREEA